MAASTPFQTADEMQAAYLSLIGGLCGAYFAARQSRNPEAFSGRGAVVPEEQLAEALTEREPSPPQEGLAESWRYLRERDNPALPLCRLFEALGASDFERLVLALALAPELDRKYERVFAYLQDNVQETRATLGLAVELYGMMLPRGGAGLFGLLAESHPLNRYLLTPLRTPEKDAAPSRLARPLALRQTALFALTGVDALPPPMARACRLIEAASPPEPLAGHDRLDQAVRFAGDCVEGGKPGCLQIYGAPGTGRRFILRTLAGRLGKSVLLIDCRELFSCTAAERRDAFEAALSYCFLRGCIPALFEFGAHSLPPAEADAALRRMLRETAEAAPFLALCGEKPLETASLPGLPTLQINMPDYKIGERKRFWQSFSRGLALDGELDLAELAGLYTLTPGQIEEVLTAAEAGRVSRGEAAVGRDAVCLAVRKLCRPRLEALTQPLVTHFTWDDLMLEEAPARQLRALRDRIRYRWKVYEQWGFDDKLPYGRGVSVLLYGPPGTGKTMAAQVLAGEFGLDAYRVDLSQIMDKYIGETEKKLGQLFEAARDANAILFFDEADALFSKRTEISDSKDRYANLETAYLLQRMEEHNGVSILATNIALNFDEAFKRRISFMVHIPLPGREIRREIWRRVFPPEAPLARGVGLDFFAERFELSGSAIKSVALSAAYLAAAEGSEITRDHIARALRDEYTKTGRVLMEHELY